MAMTCRNSIGGAQTRNCTYILLTNTFVMKCMHRIAGNTYANGINLNQCTELNILKDSF